MKYFVSIIDCFENKLNTDWLNDRMDQISRGLIFVFGLDTSEAR